MQKLFTLLERRFNRFAELPMLIDPHPSRHGLAMVCIAKNEESYIREWIAFHNLVGVRHFYIYVNDQPGRMRRVTRDFQDEGLVTIIPWENFTTAGAPQMLAYAHAIANFGAQYRWMAFLDVDEFLFPVREESLLDALRRYSDLPGVAVPWHMFGTSGHHIPPDGLVIENYTLRAPFVPTLRTHHLLQYKSIIDPARVKSIKNAHWFYMPSGRRAAFSESRQEFTLLTEHLHYSAHDDVFRLNHYFTRSVRDIRAKIERGRIDRSSVRARRGNGFSNRTRRLWAYVEENPERDTLIHRYVPALEARLRKSRVTCRIQAPLNFKPRQQIHRRPEKQYGS